MKLFWAPQTRSQRAIWMLEEAGLDYDMELVDNVEVYRGHNGLGDFELKKAAG